MAAGLVLGATGFQHANGKRTSRAPSLIASVGANALTAWYFIQINDRVQILASDTLLASIGAGLWLAVAGSIVSFVVVVAS